MIHIYGEPHAARIRGYSIPTKPFSLSVLQTYDIVVFCAQKEEDLKTIQENIHSIPPELGITVLLAAAEPGHDQLNAQIKALARPYHYFDPYLGSGNYSDIHFYISVILFVQEQRSRFLKEGVEVQGEQSL
jgi:hypothetical protein